MELKANILHAQAVLTFQYAGACMRILGLSALALSWLAGDDAVAEEAVLSTRSLRDGGTHVASPLVRTSVGNFWFVDGRKAPPRLIGFQQEVVLPAGFADTHWVFIGTFRNDLLVLPTRVWAIADRTWLGEGPGPLPALLLVHTEDAGRTWRQFSLPKPHRSAEFVSFTMTKAGTGELRVRLTADIVRDPAAVGQLGWTRAMVDTGAPANLEHGIYVYTTRDGGKSWSAPKREADDLDIQHLALP